MTRGRALLLCVVALVASACRTGVPVIDTGPKPPTADGTIAGHVSTGSGATGVPSRIVRAINVASGEKFETTTNNAGTYTLKVPPGKYRIEVELRPGERLPHHPPARRDHTRASQQIV